MTDKVEISVEVTNPQAQLDKILSNIGNSVTKLRQQFEKDIANIIAKSGVKSGKFQFTGPSGKYSTTTGDFLEESAAPNPQVIEIGPLTKTIDIAKQYTEQIKSQRIALANVEKYADRYQAALNRLSNTQEKAAQKDISGRATALANVEKYADRYQKALKRAAQQEVSDRATALENMEKYADRYQRIIKKTSQQDIAARTTALENVEKYANRYQKALDRISGAQKKTTQKEVSDRVSALQYAEELYTRNQEAKIKRREERDRQRSRQVMGLASAGIGIFGQAGFPLLNIAFASMSGMKYAGIAAVATAAGEAARFIIRLQDAARQSAESLHMLTKGFKFARAEFEVTKGAYGVLGQPAQQRRFEALDEFLAQQKGRRAYTFVENLRTEFSSKYATDLMQQSTARRASIGFFPGQLLLSPLMRAWQNSGKDMEAYSRNLREARDSMRRELNQWKASFQSPEEQWRRIQSAAMSGANDSLQIARKQLEKLDRLVALQEKEEAIERRRLEIESNNSANSYRLTGGRVNIGAEALLYQ